MFLFQVVFLVELFYLTTGIDELLLACEKGMAFIADIDFKRFNVFSGPRFKSSSASADYRNFMIIGMYFGLHIYHLAIISSNAYLLYTN